MQINNEINWVLGEFILNTLGYIVVCSGIFIFLPLSLYGLYKHIKTYGIKERIRGNHMFKGEKPLLILLFEVTALILGIYIMLIDGMIFEYLKNASLFLNS